MEWHKYTDIERLKPKYTDMFTPGDRIVVSEKVDGSNSSFSYDPDKGVVVACSRRQILDFNKTLNGFWNWVQNFDSDFIKNITDNGRYTIYGEWLVKNKIHYPDDAYHKFYMFDVYDAETGCYLPYEEMCGFYARLKLPSNTPPIFLAPVLYVGPFISWEHLYSFVGKSELGAEVGEGCVIHSQTHLDKHGKYLTHVKLVSEKFAEIQKTKKPIDPEIMKAKEAERELALTIVTKRRVEKSIQRLVEDGLIPTDWDETNMKTISQNLPRAVYNDCVKEESETVAALPNFGKICGSETMRWVREILNERNEVKA
jgi:hypothetical protein